MQHVDPGVVRRWRPSTPNHVGMDTHHGEESSKHSAVDLCRSPPRLQAHTKAMEVSRLPVSSYGDYQIVWNDVTQNAGKHARYRDPVPVGRPMSRGLGRLGQGVWGHRDPKMSLEHPLRPPAQGRTCGSVGPRRMTPRGGKHKPLARRLTGYQASLKEMEILRQGPYSRRLGSWIDLHRMMLLPLSEYARE